MSEPLIVAIDGPSGAGKSTVGRRVAAALGIAYIDTGAMYRAIGLATRRLGITLPIVDPDRVAAVAAAVRIDLVADAEVGVRVKLDGEDVTDAIREPEVALFASAVSAIPAVRRELVRLQREIGRASGGVLEGRDIGTVVFPDTPFKFFLTASANIRALRRWRELRARGNGVSYERIAREQEERDRADSSRDDSPLRIDPSHEVLDSSRLEVDEVVDRIVERVRRVRPA